MASTQHGLSRIGVSPAVLFALALVAVGFGVIRSIRATLTDERHPDRPAGPIQYTDLPTGAVRFVEVDGNGTVWLRVSSRNRRNESVVGIEPSGQPTEFGDLRSAVQARFADVVQSGTLIDFWSVDSAGRVWVGPAFYDGSDWTSVDSDVVVPGATIVYRDRILVDGSDRAWVPYEISTSCPDPGACTTIGLRAFDAQGQISEDVMLEAVPDLMHLDLHFVRFVRAGTSLAAAFGPRSMVDLNTASSVPYPGLTDGSTGLPVPGFTSAVAGMADGQAEAFTSVEVVLGEGSEARVVTEVMGNTWSQGTWTTRDLSGCPLFGSDRPSARPSAAVFGPTGDLWLGSSLGEAALLRDGAWAEHFTSRNSPLSTTVYDIAIDDSGTVWFGTADGVWTYREGEDGGWAGKGLVVIEAHDFRFEPNLVVVSAGVKLIVMLDNLGSVSNDIVFEFDDGRQVVTDLAEAGETTFVTFGTPARPALYPFFSSVSDHRERGVRGILRVAAPTKSMHLPFIRRRVDEGASQSDGIGGTDAPNGAP